MFTGEYQPPRLAQDGNIVIVVLPRGHVLVGRWYQVGETCRLYNARIIRRWGTTNGLAQIANGGPATDTKLDDIHTVSFHLKAVIMVLDCEELNWRAYL